jgi:hypothetical protein
VRGTGEGDYAVTLRGAGWLAFAGTLLVVTTVCTSPETSSWIYYQPLWTILSVGLAMLVVYALATYGGRQQPGTPARA